MTRKLRFGIIGCGVIGSLHAEAITSLPDAQLVAVADIIPELAQKLAEAFHVTPYSDFQEHTWPEDGIHILAVSTGGSLRLS